MTPRVVRRAALRALTALVASLAAGLIVSGCADRTTTAANVSWTLTPTSPVANEPATLTVELRDAAGAALTGARVRLEAYMSHPGMAPIAAEADERSSGVYVMPVVLTMPGDWVLLVTAQLADGGRVEQRIDVPHVQPTA